MTTSIQEGDDSLRSSPIGEDEVLNAPRWPRRRYVAAVAACVGVTFCWWLIDCVTAQNKYAVYVQSKYMPRQKVVTGHWPRSLSGVPRDLARTVASMPSAVAYVRMLQTVHSNYGPSLVVTAADGRACVGQLHFRTPWPRTVEVSSTTAGIPGAPAQTSAGPTQ